MTQALPLILLASILYNGQDAPTEPDSPRNPQSTRTIEDLNLVGAAVTMPLISDTMFGVESAVRTALYNEGILYFRPSGYIV